MSWIAGCWATTPTTRPVVTIPTRSSFALLEASPGLGRTPSPDRTVAEVLRRRADAIGRAQGNFAHQLYRSPHAQMSQPRRRGSLHDRDLLSSRGQASAVFSGDRVVDVGAHLDIACGVMSLEAPRPTTLPCGDVEAVARNCPAPLGP